MLLLSANTFNLDQFKRLSFGKELMNYYISQVGVKGNPKGVNKGLDCDVIVAEVRATSHKPDEIYGIIERLSPGTRKVELFGRPHNVQPNWLVFLVLFSLRRLV